MASSIRGSKPLLFVVRNASEAETAAKQEFDCVKEELHQDGGSIFHISLCPGEQLDK